jgi:hypothetical protein
LLLLTHDDQYLRQYNTIRRHGPDLAVVRSKRSAVKKWVPVYGRTHLISVITS